jgi:hypothetical protein
MAMACCGYGSLSTIGDEHPSYGVDGDSMAFDPSRFSREISYRLLVKKQHVRPMPM